MKNKNVIIIAVVGVLILAVLGMAQLFSKPAVIPGDAAPTLAVNPAAATETVAPTSEPTAMPMATEDVASPTDLPSDATEDTPSTDPVSITPNAYVLVTVNGVTYQPIPLSTEGDFTITQKDTGRENVVHVSPNGVYMKASTCQGNDCVKQGEVTIDNKDTRILGNAIVCLPNQVILEVYTTQELIDAILAQQQAEP